jgi:hypothetical protein
MVLPRRSISRLGTETFLRRSQTKSKSSSSSLVKISMHVIHCDGGLAAVPNSLTSLGLQGIFFRFRVSSQPIVSLFFSFSLTQDRPSLLNGFFQEAAIRFLCAVQDSTQKRLRPSCWSNNGFDLLATVLTTIIYSHLHSL